MKHYRYLLVSFLLLSSVSFAQFTGPSSTGRISTVTEARKAPIDTDVTVTGNVVGHLREDYYTFRDQTGEINVEIEPEIWRNQKVGPDTKVRLVAEVDRNDAGAIYLDVDSLQILN